MRTQSIGRLGESFFPFWWLGCNWYRLRCKQSPTKGFSTSKYTSTCGPPINKKRLSITPSGKRCHCHLSPSPISMDGINYELPFNKPNLPDNGVNRFFQVYRIQLFEKSYISIELKVRTKLEAFRLSFRITGNLRSTWVWYVMINHLSKNMK